MKLTNKYGLPTALVHAIENDPYDKGASDYSVTELLKPPKQAALYLKYKNEIVEDVSDKLHSLYGQIVHSILERGNKNELVEKRFFAKFGGKILSGQIDNLCLSEGVLSDYKFTTAYKFKPNSEPPVEWVLQLNMQLELLRQNGLDAKKLQIVGLLRDFSKLEALRNDDYPRTEVVIMPIQVMSREEIQETIKDLILSHEAARSGALPNCTQDERWATPDQWAVMKKGVKRAVMLRPSRVEAETVANDLHGHYVEFRPGVSRRCDSYCNVNKWCEQYQKMKGLKK